ncbi:hypothetical protein McpAg1_16730 [Methanocorpusculaceae archaeon Ag1]|uniref:Uncharacterized protein n=1 Tax=Methanorbis furvi TaxID=3028299 RepID=A0AAE4SAJ5_9EURY|nr:hypothetical protein [Methanocorpusculaceae archaeon Ag1]
MIYLFYDLHITTFTQTRNSFFCSDTEKYHISEGKLYVSYADIIQNVRNFQGHRSLMQKTYYLTPPII